MISIGKSSNNPYHLAFDECLANVSREIGCWPWDVCAGALIAQEAGGLVTGSQQHFSKTRKDGTLGYVGQEILTGRKYLVVRAIGDTEVRNVFGLLHILKPGRGRKGETRRRGSCQSFTTP